MGCWQSTMIQSHNVHTVQKEWRKRTFSHLPLLLFFLVFSSFSFSLLPRFLVRFLQSGQRNRASIEQIESSLYILCLDEFVSTKGSTASSSGRSCTGCNQRRDSIQRARMDLSYMASQLLTGGGSDFYTPNRWFDKMLQVQTNLSSSSSLTIHYEVISLKIEIHSLESQPVTNWTFLTKIFLCISLLPLSLTSCLSLSLFTSCDSFSFNFSRYSLLAVRDRERRYLRLGLWTYGLGRNHRSSFPRRILRKVSK